MPHKERSCYWNITWLDISYHIIFTYHMFLLTYHYILFTTSIYPKPSCLIIFNRYPNQVYDKQRKKPFFVVIVCVVCHALKNLFPRMTFCNVPWVVGKKNVLSPATVNASLISQFRENVVSFNFLANALTFRSI